MLSEEELLDLTKIDGGRLKVYSIEEAYQFCKFVTTNHYENFPVASILIPKRLRHHVHAIYTFARCADDIADELLTDSIEFRLQTLNDYENILLDNTYYKRNEGNPIFLALHQTMNQCKIPYLPFQKLLIAFRKDIEFIQPKNFADIEDYCSYSANPVGELILRLYGIYDENTAKYSDSICTGLQLANFWQDLSVDLKNNRCYIPQDYLTRHYLTKENLYDEENLYNLSACLNEIYNQTFKNFSTGENLIDLIPDFRLRIEIKATIEGGKRILENTRVLGSEILYKRPKISKAAMALLFLKVLF